MAQLFPILSATGQIITGRGLINSVTLTGSSGIIYTRLYDGIDTTGKLLFQLATPIEKTRNFSPKKGILFKTGIHAELFGRLRDPGGRGELRGAGRPVRPFGRRGDRTNRRGRGHLPDCRTHAGQPLRGDGRAAATITSAPSTGSSSAVEQRSPAMKIRST